MYRLLPVMLLITALGCGDSARETPAPPQQPTEPSPSAQPTPPAPPFEILVLEPEKTQPPEDPGMKVARALTEQFYRGELQKLHDRFSDEMKQTLSLEQLQQMHAAVTSKFGKEKEVIGESSAPQGPYKAFVRWGRFDKNDGVLEVQWILRPDDSVAGFFIKPRKADEKEPGA